MRETIEFRVPAGHADMFLEPGLGTMLGDSVRKIVLPMEDPRVKFIADLDRERVLKRGEQTQEVVLPQHPIEHKDSGFSRPSA